MKTLPNRVCQIEVSGEWTDPQNGLEYNFSAKVIVSRDYEIEAVDFTSMDVYDANEALNHDMAWVLATNKNVKEQLEATAGIKAIEKIQSADFDKETNND